MPKKAQQSSPQPEVPTHPVGQITTVEEQQLGLIDLGTNISHALRPQFDKQILTHGEPFQTGGVLGTACLPVLGVGAALSSSSSLLAGNIFLATANPATLMQIGGGGGLRYDRPGRNDCRPSPLHCGRERHSPRRRASRVLYDRGDNDDGGALRSNSHRLEPTG